jgi:hypothetical protein
MPRKSTYRWLLILIVIFELGFVLGVKSALHQLPLWMM